MQHEAWQRDMRYLLWHFAVQTQHTITRHYSFEASHCHASRCIVLCCIENRVILSSVISYDTLCVEGGRQVVTQDIQFGTHRILYCYSYQKFSKMLGFVLCSSVILTGPNERCHHVLTGASEEPIHSPSWWHQVQCEIWAWWIRVKIVWWKQ